MFHVDVLPGVGRQDKGVRGHAEQVVQVRGLHPVRGFQRRDLRVKR